MDAEGYCYPATLHLARNASLRPWNGPVGRDGYAVMGAAPEPRWRRETAVCIASGPSLTEEDCRLVRDTEFPVIAVNSSWRRAPFANVIFALDEAWWRHNALEITSNAERWTASPTAVEQHPELRLMIQRSRANNSGALAIELADQLGAARVLLLGYDCSVKNGSHWHGSHAKTRNPDASDTQRWFAEFESVASVVQAHVVNCSQYTELTCFSRSTLSSAIEGNP